MRSSYLKPTLPAVLAFCLFTTLSARPARAEEKAGPQNPAPPPPNQDKYYPGNSTTTLMPNPSASPFPVPPQPPAPDSPAVQARVKELIAIIESKPNGLVINNTGTVLAPPNHQPYNPDGTRNENFRVTPKNSDPKAAVILNQDQRRAQAVQELIKISRPAVWEVAIALVTENYEYRRFYVLILGEIGDPRAVPALMKYMEDGLEKLKMVPMVQKAGDAAMVKKLTDDGNRMTGEAAAALQKITGQSYGADLAKWKEWWTKNQAKAGPTPPLVQYTANPPAPAVHYSPELAQPPVQPFPPPPQNQPPPPNPPPK